MTLSTSSETPANPGFSTLRVEVEGSVGRLTLTRPERLNAMGATMLRELEGAARWFDQHRDLHVVLVSGEGRAFCAGADLKDLPLAEADPSSGKSWLYRREVAQYGLRMADAVEQMRAVTIARVHGYAVGGGLVLMAACDLRICAEDASLFIPEIDLGIPLAWGGIPRLVREIGPALTKELVMTCRRFSPAEAKAAGFVNRVVPASELEQVAEDLLAELDAKPSVPLAITKEHVNSISRAMATGYTAFADGDALLSAVQQPEARQAVIDYTTKAFGEK